MSCPARRWASALAKVQGPPGLPAQRATSVTQVAEQAVLEACHKVNSWAGLANVWLSCLIQAGLLIKHKSNDQWWVSCGDMGTMAAIGWPVIGQAGAWGSGFRLQHKAHAEDIPWLICLDPREWLAQEVSWVSPLHTMVHWTRRLRQHHRRPQG